MIELFFDQRVFEFLKKEIENLQNNIEVEEMKFIELIISASELEILPNLFKDLLDCLKFKLTQLFI